MSQRDALARVREEAVNDIRRHAMDCSSRYREAQTASLSNCFKALMFLNGGSIVALMSFVASSKSFILLDGMKMAIGVFVAGLVFSILASIGSVYYYHILVERAEDKKNSSICDLIGEEFNGRSRNRVFLIPVSVLLGAFLLFSLVMFSAGSFLAISSIS